MICSACRARDPPARAPVPAASIWRACCARCDEGLSMQAQAADVRGSRLTLFGAGHGHDRRPRPALEVFEDLLDNAIKYWRVAASSSI